MYFIDSFTTKPPHPPQGRAVQLPPIKANILKNTISFVLSTITSIHQYPITSKLPDTI